MSDLWIDIEPYSESSVDVLIDEVIKDQDNLDDQ